MFYTIRKWWFVCRLHSYLLKKDSDYSCEEMMHERSFVPVENFVTEIAEESAKRFRWILLWKIWRFQKIKSKKIAQYISITYWCNNKKPALIVVDDYQGTGINIMRASNEADEVLGVVSLLQELLSKYKLVWSIAVFPFLGGLLSTSFIGSLWHTIKETIKSFV